MRFHFHSLASKSSFVMAAAYKASPTDAAKEVQRSKVYASHGCLNYLCDRRVSSESVDDGQSEVET